MTSKTLKSAIWLTLAVGATALAAGGPPPGKGPGGGEDTLSNSLSVPTIMVGGGTFTGVTCGANGVWSPLVPPTDEPLDGYPIDPLAFYYVQGVHTWQAQCSNYVLEGGATHPAYGYWGDNLTGDARLKVGSPIRVELVLEDASSELRDGYTVVKLEPEKLDRESAYGTLATLTDGAFSATPIAKTPGVYDGNARMSIQKWPDGPFVVPDGPAKAEINALGKVVYGYSLRVSSAGQYLITFTLPNVDLTGCDAGACSGSTASLTITVAAGGGGRPPRP
jgi:hypothetical protein